MRVIHELKERHHLAWNVAGVKRDATEAFLAKAAGVLNGIAQVEEELAKAKAVIDQLQNGSQSVAKVTDHGKVDNGSSSSTRNETSSPTLLDDNASILAASHHSLHNHTNGTSANGYDRSSVQAYTYEHPPTAGRNPHVSVGAMTNPSPNSTLSLEAIPVSGNFDWDERKSLTNQSRFADGMASLTQRSSRGYMGVASGAALLRLADDANEDLGVEQEHDIQEDGLRTGLTPPMPMALFTLGQLEPFVDLYFQTYHVSYPIVHEATFRAQFMDIIPKPKGQSWQVLLHIVAALGAFAGSEVAPQVDDALFEAAKARMSVDMLETGNLVLVQALTLISNYVQKRNKPNSGYNYLGLAKRMAMGLGLHKEFPSWHAKPLMLEMRRRIWWSLYIFDVGATITFSRPLDMPEEGIEVGLPLNVPDSEVTSSTTRLPPEVEATTLYTHVRWQSKFHLATSSIYTKLISSALPSAEEMLSLDDMVLVRWLSEIPPFYQENVVQASRYRLSHSILQWRWRNFRILMYRSYLMRRFMAKGPSWTQQSNTNAHSAEERASQRCLDAATESVQLITNYWRQGSRNVMACWYGLYFLFQAILLPVICLRNDPHSSSATSWRDLILSALDTISDMARLNSAASRCHEVIMKLCGLYLAQDITQWNSPTHESPQTQLNALHSFMWPIMDPQFANIYDMGLQESITYDFMHQINGTG